MSSRPATQVYSDKSRFAAHYVSACERYRQNLLTMDLLQKGGPNSMRRCREYLHEPQRDRQPGSERLRSESHGVNTGNSATDHSADKKSCAVWLSRGCCFFLTVTDFCVYRPTVRRMGRRGDLLSVRTNLAQLELPATPRQDWSPLRLPHPEYCLCAHHTIRDGQ
jgi:hypothetical protein